MCKGPEVRRRVVFHSEREIKVARSNWRGGLGCLAKA